MASRIMTLVLRAGLGERSLQDPIGSVQEFSWPTRLTTRFMTA